MSKKVLRLKCKEPKCNKIIEFTGEVSIPGNFKFLLLENNKNKSVNLDIKKLAKTFEKARLNIRDKGLLHITQLKLPAKNKQELAFEINKLSKKKTETFYLTCEDGHTHPYNIEISS
jgi:hypothetical protein